MRRSVILALAALLLLALAGTAKAEVVMSSAWHSDLNRSTANLSYGGSPYSSYTSPNLVSYAALGVFAGGIGNTFDMDADFSAGYAFPSFTVYYGSNVGTNTYLKFIQVSEDGGSSWSDQVAFNQTLASLSNTAVTYDITSLALSYRDSVNQARFEFIIDSGSTSNQVEITAIQGNPEPATLALFGLGILAVGGVKRRQMKLARQRAQRAQL